MGYIGVITHLLTSDPNFQRDIQVYYVSSGPHHHPLKKRQDAKETHFTTQVFFPEACLGRVIKKNLCSSDPKGLFCSSDVFFSRAMCFFRENVNLKDCLNLWDWDTPNSSPLSSIKSFIIILSSLLTRTSHRIS